MVVLFYVCDLLRSRKWLNQSLYEQKKKMIDCLTYHLTYTTPPNKSYTLWRKKKSRNM